MVNATLSRAAATVTALLLFASVFTGGATALEAEADLPDTGTQVSADADTHPPSTTACLQVYIEQSLGPATVTYYCGLDAEVDEDWEPKTSTSAIPPCGNGGEVSVGPATAGYDPYCQVYAEVDEDWKPTQQTQSPNCYDIYWETEAGPVTVVLTSTCSGYVDVDEDWEPTDEAQPLDHMSPSDDPVKCFLEADSGVERWACFFGPPGP